MLGPGTKTGENETMRIIKQFAVWSFYLITPKNIRQAEFFSDFTLGRKVSSQHVWITPGQLNIYVIFTSFTRCISLLNKNVPNRQLYKWSSTVIRNIVLNSNAVGNCETYKILSFLIGMSNKEKFYTCWVNCHAQSINCKNTGDLSASECFSSPWPTR